MRSFLGNFSIFLSINFPIDSMVNGEIFSTLTAYLFSGSIFSYFFCIIDVNFAFPGHNTVYYNNKYKGCSYFLRLYCSLNFEHSRNQSQSSEFS